MLLIWSMVDSKFFWYLLDDLNILFSVSYPATQFKVSSVKATTLANKVKNTVELRSI